MHRTIEKLMANEEPVGEYFVAAKQKWADMLADITEVSVAELADRLTSEQSWFERHCGGRWDGYEVMVWSGFGSIYDVTLGYERDGLGRAEAVKLAEAFASCMCSVEIKGIARDVAASYHLERVNGRYE